MVIVLQKLVVDIVWFVRLKYIKKNLLKIKKQEIKRSFVGKNTNNLLEMQCCKRIGEKKKKKKFVFWGKNTHHDKT